MLKRARTAVSFLSQKLFRKKLHFFHFSHLALILKDFFQKKLHLFSDLSEVFLFGKVIFGYLFIKTVFFSSSIRYVLLPSQF